MTFRCQKASKMVYNMGIYRTVTDRIDVSVPKQTTPYLNKIMITTKPSSCAIYDTSYQKAGVFESHRSTNYRTDSKYTTILEWVFFIFL